MKRGTYQAVRAVWSACIVLCAGISIAHAVVPGERIDRDNWHRVAELLPTSVLEWVKKGELTLTIGAMQDEVQWEEPFMSASERNADRYDVDDEGGLIDRATRVRPPHTYGFPFPHIDATNPADGIKVMWNATMTTFKFGTLHSPFALHWIGRNGFERVVQGHAIGVAYDYQPRAIPNPERTETRDLFQATSPASADGIATLTWRYIDNRPDSVWGYAPAARRIRQLTAANRSDPAYGSDITVDDGFLWLGKNQSFTWKLIGAQQILVGAVIPAHVALQRGRQWSGGQEWISPATFPGVKFGWELDHSELAPWMPTNFIRVERPVWVVEGYPKDRYYNGGRHLFYVDQVTFKPYYKIVFTPSGEYWRTVLNDLGIGTTGDGVRQVMVGAIISVDDRAHHASYSRGNAADLIVEYNSAAAQPQLFSMQGLMRFGK